jgi:nitrite reductase/ring-hydroxylating ferredoxin subunit
MKSEREIWVCEGEHLKEGNYKRVDVSFANEPSSVVVFRLNGQCMAYRNLCVHMPRRLDCEKDMIFDNTGKNLRCSMHGIVYDPITGASVSAICNGEKLTPVRVKENHQGIWIVDKRIRTLPCEYDNS